MQLKTKHEGRQGTTAPRPQNLLPNQNLRVKARLDSWQRGKCRNKSSELRVSCPACKNNEKWSLRVSFVSGKVPRGLL